ncbi:MAG: porin, partial [Candidatus Aminicenantes bacterium]|nr:porin [Candidatus Aminicenantes bacterium]
AAALAAAAPAASGQSQDPSLALSVGSKLKLSGFAQASYSWTNEGVDTFTLRRARLTLAGDVAPKVKIKLQADLTKSPVLLDAMVDVQLASAFGLRIGQFYLPFGRECRISTADLETVFRSQVSERLAPGRDIGSSGRDIGAQVFGQFSVFEYMAGVFNGSGINKPDNNQKKDVGARLAVQPASGLSLGASVYEGRTVPVSGGPEYARRRTGFDGALSLGGLLLRAEWMSGRDDRTSKDGWFLQGAWDVVPKKVQAVAKWDSYDPDRDASDDRTGILTLGGVWRLSDRTRILANALWSRRQGAESASRSLILQLQAGF